MAGSRSDVIVVGAGAIGLAIADRVTRSGRTVTVLDARTPARGASWAGSGALSLLLPKAAPRALRTLAAASAELWPGFAADLEQRTGVSVERRNSGLLRLVMSESTAAGVRAAEAWLHREGISCERLDAAGVRALAPLVTGAVAEGLFQPDLWQMRPPRLLRALLAVVHGSVRGNEAVRELILEGSRVSGVRTISGTWLAAEEVVVCAGCWSGPLLRVVLGRDLPVRPLRGQIACLDSPGAPPGQTPLLLGEGSHYLIPRADGRVLAGSTFEDVGFDERVTADGLRDVLDGAIAIAPGLARASVAASWAGLRPGTPDGLPFLGRVTDGLTVATGHFRDGLLLTPVTAEIVACLLERRPPPVDLEPYRADRDRGQPPGNTENVAMSYAV